MLHYFLDLKKHLLSSTATPDIGNTDIHVITGCLKEFLRSLSEPLITTRFYNDLIDAINQQDFNATTVHKILSELPQPNRDSLAYIVLHLQQVANSPECKMTTENLAKILGPTLVGYNPEITQDKMVAEMESLATVMLGLLKLPETFWNALTEMKQ